eukprot:tig00000444_g794.t1
MVATWLSSAAPDATEAERMDAEPAPAKEAKPSPSPAHSQHSRPVVAVPGPLSPAAAHSKAHVVLDDETWEWQFQRGALHTVDLARRTQYFRKQLIHEFRTLQQDAYDDTKLAPRYNSREIIRSARGGGAPADRQVLRSVLRETPLQLVKFKPLKRTIDEEKRQMKASLDKRLLRVRSINTLPVPVWAAWVVNSALFNNAVVLLIMLNAVVLGLQADLQPEVHHAGLQALRILDYFILAIFLLEILLKWIDDFPGYWRDPWNIFDFLVTMMSLIPELLTAGSGGGSANGNFKVARQLRVFRVFRSLKMVARFRSLRIIVRTIIEAFADFGYVLLLLVILFYIYGVFSVSLFESYNVSPLPGLAFQHKFSTLGGSFLTLFQLLTLDQWYSICTEIAEYTLKPVTIIFFLTWVWIGAFIFRNIFIGVMVKKFRSISAELAQEEAAERRRARDEKMRRKLLKELAQRGPGPQRAPGGGGLSSAALAIAEAAMEDAEAEAAEERAEEEAGAGTVWERAARLEAIKAKREKEEKERGRGVKFDLARADSHPEETPTARAERTNLARLEELREKASEALTRLSPRAPGDAPAPAPAPAPGAGEEEGREESGEARVAALAEASLRRRGDLAGMLAHANASKMQEDATMWEQVLSRTLPALASRTGETVWPRAVLLEYLQVMQELQENMLEYQQLEHLTALALHHAADT